MFRVSQKIIAKTAGVHVSTVSLALRNSPKIPQKTRLKIQTIAKQLGYTEDPFLSALCRYREAQKNTGHSLTLAFISDWNRPLTEVSHHRHFLHGARSRAAEMGFKLDEFSVHNQRLDSRRLQGILDSRNIEGLILSSFVNGRPHIDLDWEGFSALRIGYQPTFPALHSIAVNHQQSVRLAMQKAAEHGYRRPGLAIGRDWPRLVNHDWEIAYSWEQQKLPVKDRIPCFLYPYENGLPKCEGIEKWHAKYRPDLLIAPSNIYPETCERIGRSAPQDFGFIDCFLDQPDPNCAGVIHACGVIGRLAIDLLSGMLVNHRHGIPEPPSQTLIDSTWQDGPTLRRI